MQRHRRQVLALSLLLIVGSDVAADYQKGFDAYSEGDYATALTEWQPLAEQGDAGGQFGLGLLYAASILLFTRDQSPVRCACSIKSGVLGAQPSNRNNTGMLSAFTLLEPQKFLQSLICRCCNSAWCCMAATIGSIRQRRTNVALFVTPASRFRAEHRHTIARIDVRRAAL